MRRTLLRLWIFGLAFGLGISVSALWRLYRLYQVPKVSEVILTAPVPPVETLSLKIVARIHACGPQANYHIYDVSDGSQISTSCETFASPAAAARAFQARVGKAQVLERSENLNEQGRRVGEKVLVASATVLRLSRHEKTLCMTQAPSLRHLHMFER